MEQNRIVSKEFCEEICCEKEQLKIKEVISKQIESNYEVARKK